MNRQTIPIHEIQVLDRQRIELGDIDTLAASLNRFGLIQPIVINQERRLIAGGRRLTAARQLGWKDIDVVFRETMSADELHELELEENVRRQEMSWQEKALNILKIHELKSKRSAIEGKKWGMRETAEMLGIKGQSNVSYNNEIAKKLKLELTLPQEQRRFWQCENMSKAWQLRLRDEEDILAASLAKESTERLHSVSPAVDSSTVASLSDLIPANLFTAPLSSDISHSITDADILLRRQQNESLLLEFTKRIREKGFSSLTSLEAEDLYSLTQHEEGEDFQTWYKKRSAQTEPWLTIPLSKLLHKGSCINYMLTYPESVDHIITDPPYGIDMGMLNQGNDGHAFQDIDTVLAEHTVSGNEELFTQFFPAAYHCLKPNGFLILWCDIMQWQRLYDLAISAGFKVQRWPITWIKTHRCMNQSIDKNFTKTTEIAMVCRKGTISMAERADECHILASHDDYKDQLGHPFVKPFEVWDYLISHVSFSGQTILEPFAGRGSRVISIIRKDRRFIACELNEQHFNALVENVKQHYIKQNSNYKFI